MKFSLSLKYACSVSIIIIFTSILLSATFISNQIEMMEKNLIDKGFSLVKSFADNSEFGIVFYNQEQLDGMASSLLNQEDVVYTLITDKNNEVINYSGKGNWSKQISISPQIDVPQGQDTAYQLLPLENSDEGVFHFSSNIYSASFQNEEPELTLFAGAMENSTVKRNIGKAHLGMSLVRMRSAVKVARTKLILLTALIVFAGIVTSFLLSLYVTKPIQNLLVATHQISGGNLEFKLTEETNDEIGELAKSFNKMTNTLQKTTVSRNYVDNILRSTSDVLIVTTLGGIIERINNTARTCLGFQEKELVGKEFISIVRTSDDHPMEFNQFIEDCPLANVERIYVTKDSRKVPMLFSCSLLHDSNTNTERIITVAQDITKLKGIENDLREAKKNAENANAAKSEFLANMSHELRTPLHGILSFAGFGIREADNGSREDFLDYFQKIDQSGRSLLLLLNDLLDLSKLEAGKVSFEFIVDDLSLLVFQTVDEFSSLASEKNIKIEYKNPENSSPVLHDPNRITQVFRNLMSNALKFSPEHGIVQVCLSEPSSVVRFSVTDQGIGIPEDELEAVFDKFIQSRKTRTGAGGTGLGLSICREIINAHKGRIWAENNAKSGSIFSFELPIDNQRNRDNS